MSAVFAEYHDWQSAGAYKLLCDQRERYIEQSKRTRGGIVAPFPSRSPNSPTPPGRAALFSSEDQSE